MLSYISTEKVYLSAYVYLYMYIYYDMLIKTIQEDI